MAHNVSADRKCHTKGRPCRVDQLNGIPTLVRSGSDTRKWPLDPLLPKAFPRIHKMNILPEVVPAATRRLERLTIYDDGIHAHQLARGGALLSVPAETPEHPGGHLLVMRASLQPHRPTRCAPSPTQDTPRSAAAPSSIAVRMTAG